MKINILLPYKEEYLGINAGAVSILVKDQLKFSKYKKNTFVYGVENNLSKSINLKNKFIPIPKSKFLRNYLYIKKFSELIKNETSIVELHNRPYYLSYLNKIFPNNHYFLYIHNNPLELKGSRTATERKYILQNCKQVVFLSKWIENKFFLNIDKKKYNNFSVIYPFIKKIKKIPIKKNIILFSGKLNIAKGYDIFCEATKEFLKKNKNWKVISIGSEPRRNIDHYEHVKELGQIKHQQVLQYIKKSKITVAPSVWDEPLGRLPIESAAYGSVCISSDKGGLVESNQNGLLIKNINKEKILKQLNFLKKVKNYKFFQIKAFKNFNSTYGNGYLKIDKIKNKFLVSINKNFLKKKLKIFHVSNFNDNSNGRLFYSTQRKINFGFLKLGHNIYDLDEKLFLRKNKINPFKFIEFNTKVIEINKNFFPDLIIIGHLNSILPETLLEIKKNNPNVKIIRIYIDSISSEFFNKNAQYLLNNFNLIDHIFITSKTNSLLNKFKKKISYIPNMTDSSIDTLKNFNNKNFQYDLFFALSHGQNRGYFKKNFNDERDFYLKKINNKTPFLNKYFVATNFNNPIWGVEFINVLSKCQMGLNISRGTYQDFYSSDRISSLFGNGLLVFLETKTKLQKFFKKEAIFFNGINDLVKKLKYFKNNQSIAKNIAKKGYLKYHKFFSNTEVCKYILKKIELTKDKKKYIWEDI